MIVEKVSISALNKVYIGIGIASFVLSWFLPNINETYKLMLLLASVVFLGIIYLSPYLKIADKVEDRVEEINKKVENLEELINIKSDIKLLKNKVFHHD